MVQLRPQNHGKIGQTEFQASKILSRNIHFKIYIGKILYIAGGSQTVSCS